jgi:hypothetical protein
VKEGNRLHFLHRGFLSMSRFITRGELHYAHDADYNNLHAAMAREGFSRTILSNENVAYNLPTAEYHTQGYLTLNDVLESAKRAVSTTGRAFGVIVSQFTNSSWSGLPQA